MSVDFAVKYVGARADLNDRAIAFHPYETGPLGHGQRFAVASGNVDDRRGVRRNAGAQNKLALVPIPLDPNGALG